LRDRNRVSPPRPPQLRLHGLAEGRAEELQAGGSSDGRHFEGVALDGIDLTGADFLECQFDAPIITDAMLRGARFRDCLIVDSYSPVLSAPRSSWKETVVRRPRWGSAELYDSVLQSVHFDGGKLDFLNFRDARLTDVMFSNCIIDELDLGGSTVTRVALKDCTVGTLDVGAAVLTDFDLRGTGMRTIKGVGHLGGAVIDDEQLAMLAPLFAEQLGIRVR
jgi:uncharacterized protein YjbI with pentapeptide repeats